LNRGVGINNMAKKNVTIREIAKEAGLSIATVSRFLNNSGYISDEAKIKIQEVMTRFDYKPNQIARGLAKQKTNTIALIIPDITNPFFPELVVSIEEAATSKGYSLILINTQENKIHSNNIFKNLQNRYVDGIILASFQIDDDVLDIIEKLQIPFVRIDRAANINSTNSIGIDNFKGAVMAVEHLIQVGCKNIAHISGPKNFPPSIERKKGYIHTINQYKLQEKPIVYEGDFSLESGKKMTELLIKEHKNIDGIFAANDLMAIGSLKALRLLNIDVPYDIAIIGFDGIKLTEIVEPEISTIEQPIYNIGILATNQLINQIENRPIENEGIENLQFRLIKRKSTLGFKKN
jgi:LacI family transcriptional regulator